MKKIPIGNEDFKDLIESNSYYVDKTEVIEELLSTGSKITLFPRPRRFGKSLLISMLDNFLDIDKKEENKDLFKDLYISKSEYASIQGKYPVIILDFKSLKRDTFESAYNNFKILIKEIYTIKSYLINILDEDEKKIFNLIKSGEANKDDYEQSIKYLSMWLERYHKEKVIILIDEYDAGINEGYISGYYDEMTSLIRNVFSSALKGNGSLKMGVITGVLRIGGESLFSDFNNLDIYDVMSNHYREYFGFTESETKELLEYYGLELTNEVKESYNGYNISGLSIYNPWSILNYAKRKELKPYWANTSSNKLIKELLKNLTEDNKIKIEELIKGNSVTFKYDERITYEAFADVHDTNKVFNLLLTSGYVTYDRKEINEYDDVYNYYRIPNKEVREDLISIIQKVEFNRELDEILEFQNFKIDLIEGRKDRVEKFINNLILGMSYYDTKEMFYHGYSLGLFSGFLNSRHIVKSNREAGNGRYDIMIKRHDKKYGLLFEFKVCDSEEEMETKALEGINQMKEKEYYKELKLEGIENIQEYVIVFSGKKCIVR